MIVTADLGSGHHLPIGSEVVAIDGIRAHDMLAKMLPYARTDGSNDAPKVADLGIPGDDDQPTFDVLRALLFPSPGPSARVVARIDGRTVVIACPLMTAAARETALRHPSQDSPYGWTFEVRGRVGILTMPTWAVFHEKWDWQGFIDASLASEYEQPVSGSIEAFIGGDAAYRSSTNFANQPIRLRTRPTTCCSTSAWACARRIGHRAHRCSCAMRPIIMSSRHGPTCSNLRRIPFRPGP